VSEGFTLAQFGTMQAGEENFLAVYNALISTLEDLQRQLQGSLAQWTGSAQGAYQTSKAQWDAAAAHMALVLNQLGNVIGTANTTYQETERGLTSLWD
jgi:WXG100 family type VII secretion target